MIHPRFNFIHKRLGEDIARLIAERSSYSYSRLALGTRMGLEAVGIPNQGELGRPSAQQHIVKYVSGLDLGRLCPRANAIGY
jgi:hypothetical protein